MSLYDVKRAGLLKPGPEDDGMARTTTIRATRQTTGALRAIAARLGYTAQTGPFAGGGDAAAMLEAVARGDLEVVRSAGRSDALPDAPKGGQMPPSAEK